MKYLGSCLCKTVEYEISGSFEDFFLCHCKSCRKDTGSAHAANLFSTNANIKWLKGEKAIKSYNHNNSGHIKSFCSQCGSALPNIQMNGKLLVVPAGSLDSEIYIKPSGHIFMKDKANWDEGLEQYPHYEQLPKG